jgi:hypothetical protein
MVPAKGEETTNKNMENMKASAQLATESYEWAKVRLLGVFDRRACPCNRPLDMNWQVTAPTPGRLGKHL